MTYPIFLYVEPYSQPITHILYAIYSIYTHVYPNKNWTAFQLLNLSTLSIWPASLYSPKPYGYIHAYTMNTML